MIDLLARLELAEQGPRFRAPAGTAGASGFQEAVHAVRTELLERHSDMLRDSLFDPVLARQLSDVIVQILHQRDLMVSGYQRRELALAIQDEICGLSVLEKYLRSPSVTDIFVNNWQTIIVEEAGVRRLVENRFASHEELMHVLRRIADRVGERLDRTQPELDATLPDGSRIHALVPPAAQDSANLTIRKHTTREWRLSDEVAAGVMSAEMAAFLRHCVVGYLNVAIGGPCGAGKTTVLNALAAEIPQTRRVIVVEDTPELWLHHRHPNCIASTRCDAIDCYRLVIGALRQNPECIIVGEVRQKEGFAFLEALSTGHQGMTTGHALTTDGLIQRLIRVLLTAHYDVPEKVLREQVLQCIDIVCMMRRCPDGQRRMVAIVEVGPDGLRPLYEYDFHLGRFVRRNQFSSSKLRKLEEYNAPPPPDHQIPEEPAHDR